eukprot:gnl/TRDRNA2_/TRDRNA2_145181_c0_seq1.p1 gnl/TRDRNA2_/TRDRNA2_145181_c0~~gnl/TRDRNA2_/TRDRNA2_145181_c0_seq1.p1  ORF type:complete len:388 (+),score=53.06 gnl/TRDRNA2_/TRDRNA2_145181_c0_seq1:29-1165(+)
MLCSVLHDLGRLRETVERVIREPLGGVAARYLACHAGWAAFCLGQREHSALFYAAAVEENPDSVLFAHLLAEAKGELLPFEMLEALLAAPDERVYQDLVLAQDIGADNPHWILVDNKVQLHRLVRGRHFWPLSYELPAEALEVVRLRRTQMASPEEHGSDLDGGTVRWIVKKPASMGGVGNTVLRGGLDTLPEALLQSSAPCLLQEYVRPPLLLRSRKFSVRLYVAAYDFLPDRLEAYASSLGLVILAPSEYSDTAESPEDRGRHITNQSATMQTLASGQVEGFEFTQDFGFLEDELSKQSGPRFEEVWTRLKDVCGCAFRGRGESPLLHAVRAVVRVAGEVGNGQRCLAIAVGSLRSPRGHLARSCRCSRKVSTVSS